MKAKIRETESDSIKNKRLEKGTLVRHNTEPSHVVLVVETSESDSRHFKRVSLGTGKWNLEYSDSYVKAVFQRFSGEILLTQ